MEDRLQNTIRKFIEIYDSCQEVEDKLSDLLLAAIGSGQADDWTGDQRTDAVLFEKELVKLIRAIYSNSKEFNH